MFLPLLLKTPHADFESDPSKPKLKPCDRSQNNPNSISANDAIHYICDNVTYKISRSVAHCNFRQREE
jgi:hypothetical protein